jgi:hypothetical protein
MSGQRTGSISPAAFWLVAGGTTTAAAAAGALAGIWASMLVVGVLLIVVGLIGSVTDWATS